MARCEGEGESVCATVGEGLKRETVFFGAGVPESEWVGGWVSDAARM